MNLTSYDYYSDKPDPTIGFTRTASLIHAARQQAQDDGALVLLFDNGDSLQGTPFGEWAAGQAEDMHPLMQAFGALKYDAIGLGNHDFNFGLSVLDRIVGQAPCPAVCSNAHCLMTEQSWQDSAILEREVSLGEHSVLIRIGVLSVLPPQTTRWEAHRLQNTVAVDDILTSARKTSADLRARGCDLIVALAHSGLGASLAQPGMENAVVPLAEIDEIDAIVAGHSHLRLPGGAYDGLDHVDANMGRVHGKPVVMPGSAGSHLGVIDLEMQQTSAGWRVDDHHTELRPIHSTAKTVPEDPDLIHLFAPGHAETRARAAESVGHVSQDLHSYFSFCAYDRSLAMVAAAQAAALRPFLQNTPFAALPVLSATSPSKFGGRAGPKSYTDVPAGEVCLRHVADLHVFPNELRAVLVTGAQVRDWLEMSAGLFNRLETGTEADLTDTHRAGHNFDVLHGLSCQIDLAQPPRFDATGAIIDPTHHRISNLWFEGQHVTPDQQFIVALNNYRASGGGHFPFIQQAQPINLPPMQIQDILKDYLSGRMPRDPLEHSIRPFSFAPLLDARAVLRTGPGALGHLAELDEYAPEVLGVDPDGFLQIRLTL